MYLKKNEFNNKILHYNVKKKLPYPDKSINCVVTSPPYWNMRDYRVRGQIGLEKTPQQYVRTIVKVFREVRRILKDDGTVWLNLGDTYSDKDDKNFKNKDLIGIPWMVAFALRKDGWYLRQDNIWNKPNVMPESVKDRCTKAHEYIFLLSKSEKYYFNHEAIKEDILSDKGNRKVFRGGGKYTHDNAYNNNTLKENSISGNKLNNSLLRAKRSVWDIATESTDYNHSATFPQKLVEPCIKAGVPKGGIVCDIFSGIGTTALVAAKLGVRFTALEINKQNITDTHNRMDKELGVFNPLI